MYECVLCLGNWRKQTSEVEILISELQSKLWKRHLRALHHGPHGSEEPGIPPESTPTHTPRSPPDPRVDGSSISHSKADTWRACLWCCTAHRSSGIVCSQTKRHSLFSCAVLGTALCTATPKAHVPSKFVMLLVSGTFFFPTSEINEISISHLTQWLCLFPPE